MSRYFTILLLLVLSFQSISQSITDSLLLYYPMNGNVIDVSGNNFHGTSFGVIPVQDRFGNDSSAFYFDGVNDYIDFPLNDTLKPDFPITIALWVKLKTLQVNKNKLFNTDFVQDNYHGVFSSIDSFGRVGVSIGGGAGGAGPHNRISFKTNEVVIDTGIWHHITYIVRSSTDMEIWVNCVDANAMYSSGTGPSTIAYSNSSSGTIGRIDNNSNLPPNYNWGYVDEFAYWERDLTSIEVYNLCDSTPLINYRSTWNCVNGNCVNPGNGLGTYSNFSTCQSSCVASSMDKNISSKKCIKIIDFLGRNSFIKTNVLLFYFYDDGSVVKKFIKE